MDHESNSLDILSVSCGLIRNNEAVISGDCSNVSCNIKKCFHPNVECIFSYYKDSAFIEYESIPVKCPILQNSQGVNEKFLTDKLVSTANIEPRSLQASLSIVDKDIHIIFLSLMEDSVLSISTDNSFILSNDFLFPVYKNTSTLNVPNNAILGKKSNLGLFSIIKHKHLKNGYKKELISNRIDIP